MDHVVSFTFTSKLVKYCPLYDNILNQQDINRFAYGSYRNMTSLYRRQITNFGTKTLQTDFDINIEFYGKIGLTI